MRVDLLLFVRIARARFFFFFDRTRKSELMEYRAGVFSECEGAYEKAIFGRFPEWRISRDETDSDLVRAMEQTILSMLSAFQYDIYRNRQ